MSNEKLQLLAVGDLFMNRETLEDILPAGLSDHMDLKIVQWPLTDLEELQRLNLIFEKNGPEGEEPPQVLMDAVASAHVLFTQFCPVSSKVMDAAPNLKVIAVGRSGVQNINVEAATERGICVLNTVGRNAQAVAEYTIGLMLCEARNIGRGHAALKQGLWRKDYPNDDSVPELPGRTVGLVGLGSIGRMVVQKLSGFDLHCIVFDPYLSDEAAAAAGVEKVDLETLMKSSDFVSIHAKLTDETRRMINEDLLNLMKPTAYFINTARAELVDEPALVKILQEGRIAGAALDVYMNEPPPADDPILALDNITLSPHQGGVTADAYRTTAKMFVENISRLWQGDEGPRNLLNPETADTLKALKAQVG